LNFSGSHNITAPPSRSKTFPSRSVGFQATAGIVQLDGSDVFTNVQSYKSMLGYVPEEPHLRR
jgi:hypothetical protein